MSEIPRIVSVDDHVIEPAHVWQDRLPQRYKDVGPRVVQERGNMSFVGGNFSYEPDPDGQLGDWWVYEDKRVPQTRLSAAAGFDRDDVKVVGITYDEMRDGCYDPAARLEDMDVNHVEAYNDWMVEEWCGDSGGRLIPLCIIPLWDAELAAAEVRRNAGRGVHAVCFSEIPPYLGLPSIHDADGYWEPFVQACAETGTVINMHIGSSSKMPSTYYYRQMYGCFFDDEVGLEMLERVGISNVTFETDYPHSDSTWPHTKEVAQKLMGHLPDDTVRKLVRGNAIEMLSLDLEE